MSNNIYAVSDPLGIEYLYMCGGAASGINTYEFVAQNWSECLGPCDLRPNCTACEYNGGLAYGVQNNSGQGQCTFKTDGLQTFTTTSSSDLQSTRVAGIQKRAYRSCEFCQL